MTRGALEERVICPNCGTEMSAFGKLKTLWLNVLNESQRNTTLCPSDQGSKKVFKTDVSRFQKREPRRTFRLPVSPWSGKRKALSAVSGSLKNWISASLS